MTDKTFAEQVTEAVDKLVEKDGVWEFPPELLEELPEAVAFSAKQEKRIRDNNAAYHKANRKARELETINNQLTTHLIDNATLHLSTEQRTELDELKLTDPDAWRAKLTQYESEAKTILANKVKEISTSGQQLTELEEREAKLAAFVETTGIQLTDEVIESQLPASYSKQLAAGTITFDDFLAKAQGFLTKPKVIAGANSKALEEEPNLGALPGGSEPSIEAQDADLTEVYVKSTIF